MTSLSPQDFASVSETGAFGSHVIVVGGGASGALMALHLLDSAPDLRVTVIERNALLGCGIAYGTRDPNHLLNTRVHNMSAFPDRVGHFRDWLRGSGLAPAATEESFVGRTIYGRYLSDLIVQARDDRPGRLRCVHGECLRLEETPRAVIAHVDDGTCIRADRAVLATGHAVGAPEPGLRGAWDFTPPADAAQPVVIIGTGLSMVDHVVLLLRLGHAGPITCVSRRGLLPQVHDDGHALPIGRGEVPLGAPVSAVLHWLRGLVIRAEALGGTWRDAVDGIRPHVAALWRAWGEANRRRFLRHAASFWEVHRHRVPPESARWLREARDRGQLRVLRGRFDRVTPEGARVRTAAEVVTLPAGRVIDCRGIRRDPARDSAPVIRDMLERGACRLDRLHLGLDTDELCRVLGPDGRASQKVFAIGPCARGALWEITAIPDIRVQCAGLARHMAEVH